MLINLSNHPQSRWLPEQLEAAKSYGKIHDIPFPHVPPEASTEELYALADEYIAKIQEVKASSDTPVTVHLMGELTLTFALVNKLQAAGIPCVASTTWREVLEEENGRKTTQFHFKQFRAYPEK